MARQERHQLHVDISWQMPPKNNSVLLRAFKLQVNGTEGDRCFVFNVTDFGWTQDSASPRFHFTSESLFEFSEGYRITLYSLPASTSRTPVVVKESRMPVDPELTYDDDRSNISQYCKTHSEFFFFSYRIINLCCMTFWTMNILCFVLAQLQQIVENISKSPKASVTNY
ncbi:hypothetical protein ANCCAN_06370 [Ancylostoma caninum]|uniref:Uncharacterized protein n=1 Tax=Ancylostoma caninum TaxID=29170 RepID=A0A368GT82_ANCCA|nr:hypothetical protein ANCCAN_06370 [Ancylostoma caninum]